MRTVGLAFIFWAVAPLVSLGQVTFSLQGKLGASNFVVIDTHPTVVYNEIHPMPALEVGPAVHIQWPGHYAGIGLAVNYGFRSFLMDIVDLNTLEVVEKKYFRSHSIEIPLYATYVFGKDWRVFLGYRIGNYFKVSETSWMPANRRWDHGPVFGFQKPINEMSAVGFNCSIGRRQQLFWEIPTDRIGYDALHLTYSYRLK